MSTLATMFKKSIEMGFTHILSSDNVIHPLEEIKDNSQGWFFNLAWSQANITKYNRKWKNLGHYKLLRENNVNGVKTYSNDWITKDITNS